MKFHCFVEQKTDKGWVCLNPFKETFWVEPNTKLNTGHMPRSIQAQPGTFKACLKDNPESTDGRGYCIYSSYLKFQFSTETQETSRIFKKGFFTTALPLDLSQTLRHVAHQFHYEELVTDFQYALPFVIEEKDISKHLMLCLVDQDETVEKFFKKLNRYLQDMKPPGVVYPGEDWRIITFATVNSYHNLINTQQDSRRNESL